MHPDSVKTRTRHTTGIAVAARQDAAAGIASYVTIAGIAAGLIVVWAGICLI